MVMRVDKRMTDMLPKGVLGYALKLPALKGVRRTVLADLGVPDTVLEYVSLKPRFDARDTARALEGIGHRGPAARDLRREAVGLLGAQPRSRPVPRPLVRGRDQRQARADHRRLVGHRPAAAHKIAAAGGIPILVARSMDKLEEAKAEIEREGGTAYVYSCDLSDYDAIDTLVEQVFSDHPSVDILINNAGRSIRRSVALPTTASTTSSARCA